MANTPKKDFRCSGLEEACFDEIERMKAKHKKYSNKDIIEMLIDQHIDIDKKTMTKLTEACAYMKTTPSKLLTPVIDRYLNKTLKDRGVVKEKNKKSVVAEAEMIQILQDMVAHYKTLPAIERKYLSASMVHRFIGRHEQPDGTNKYKLKHNNVVVRVLASGEADFVKKYHKENKLDEKSNAKRIKK